MRRFLHFPTQYKYAEFLLVAGLLALLLLQVWSSVNRINLLGDEGTHLASGYSYWQSRDFRLNREHPPIVKLVAAWPLLFKDLSIEQSWQYVSSAPPWDITTSHQWDFADSLLLQENVQQLEGNLAAARRAVSVFAVILAVSIYFFSRQLFGILGGMISLLVTVFNPDILAHAGLVTTDMAMATYYFATPMVFWWYCQRPSRAKLALVGVALGLGLGSKYSNLLLLPLLAVLAAVAWQGGPASASQALAWFNPFAQGHLGQRFRASCTAGLAVLAAASAVLWGAFLGREPFTEYWLSFKQLHSNINPDFVYFLLGEYSPEHFWNYFLVTMGLKTPLPVFLLLALALAAFWVSWRQTLSPLSKWVLFFPPLLLFVVMSYKAQNIGNRYVLGIYPYIFVLIGMVSFWLRQPPKMFGAASALLVIVGLGASVHSGVRAYPFYLAFHNAIVPSSMDFIEYLDDSNNDWGQGWLELARIQKEEQLPPMFVYLSFYGSESLLKTIPGNWVLTEQFFSPDLPPPGLHAFSANMYHRSREWYRKQNINIPLLHDYKPKRIIAGSIVLIEVPAQG